MRDGRRSSRTCREGRRQRREGCTRAGGIGRDLRRGTSARRVGERSQQIGRLKIGVSSRVRTHCSTSTLLTCRSATSNHERAKASSVNCACLVVATSRRQSSSIALSHSRGSMRVSCCVSFTTRSASNARTHAHATSWPSPDAVFRGLTHSEARQRLWSAVVLVWLCCGRARHRARRLGSALPRVQSFRYMVR
jgi:hypothetical protein